jgi:membrane-bound lytic murein transglycosylase D
VVTPVEALATVADQDLAASAAAEAPAPAAASTASAVAVTAAINIAAGDVFERLRSGFMLSDVDERAVDRELNWFANNPAYLERVWGRAELYMHYIVEQLERRGMPRELGLLPVIESAYEPYAYSKARASGLWQFIPGTGSKYGLKQNWWYDGRRDVVESTRAALDYLQELHDEFDGDWLLAVAAYNCGEGAVERAIKRNQRAGKPADFWHLKLPTETRAYVPKLLAMRRLMARPADYGLEFSRIPDVAYFASVNTGGQIDLQVVAEVAGITKDELYELNPAFHRWATDPTGPYKVLVPIEVADGLEQTLLSLSPEQRMRVQQYTVQRTDTVASVAQQFSTSPALVRELNGMPANATLAVGDSLRVPSSTVLLPDKAARAAELFDRRNDTKLARRGRRPDIHVVRRGDTLASIARRMGTDTRTLARLNDMKVGDTLRAGQRLVVAQAPARTAASTASAATSTRSVAAASSQSAADGKRVTYTVRRGDTLYSISRILQVTVGELLGWNSIGKSGAIRPGQKLVAFVR